MNASTGKPCKLPLLLRLNVPTHNFFRDLTHAAVVRARGPEPCAPKFLGFQLRKLVEQVDRADAFQRFSDVQWGFCRRGLHEQVHVIWHDLQFFK